MSERQKLTPAQVDFLWRQVPLLKTKLAVTGVVVTCFCGLPMSLKASAWGLFWACTGFPHTCDGTHGAYPDGRPLGVPVDRPTREARTAAHKSFDRLWREGRMTRGQAYEALCEVFDLTDAQGHMAQMTLDQALAVVAWADSIHAGFAKPRRR